MTAQARMLIVGVIAPLVLGAVGVIAILAVIPRLPDPIAVHWNFEGTPDRFGGPVVGILLLALLAVVFAAFGFGVSRLGNGLVSATQRFMLALGPTFVGFIAFVTAGSTVLQAGLTDGHDAPSILPVMAYGLGVVIVLGVTAWFALPTPVPAPHVDPAQLPAVALGATERVSWIQHLEPTRLVGTFIVGLLAAAIVGGGVAMAFLAPLAVFVIWTAVMLLVAVVAIASLFWIVSIDGRGLIVRSVLRFPRFAIAPGEVASATLVDIVPLRDFGGWGIRGIGKRIGVVIRAGEAIEVTRKDGRVFIVTVPQAARGAALLNAVAARA